MRLGTTTVWRFDAPGKPLTAVEVPLPEPGDGEVLVAVRCCTLCGSDLHTLSGRRSAGAAMVLGHEVVGDVVAVGNGARASLGQRVVWALAVPCGSCRACERGEPEYCTARFKYGHAPFESAPLSGGLGGHVLLVSGTAIERVPVGLDDTVAATSMCAGATAAAALRHAGPIEGRRVLVLGTGLLGLTGAAFARAAGATEVVAVDRIQARAERALEFGATKSLVADDGVDGALAAIAPGGFDVALEFTGASPAAATALRALAIGGRLVLVGAVAPAPPIEVEPEDIVRRRLSLIGVHNYTPPDLRTALRLLAESDAPFESTVDAALPLAELEATLHRRSAGRGLRAAFVP